MASEDIAVGSSVESLIPDDNLFYAGTVTESITDTYTVRFEDGEVHTIPRAWVKPNQRVEIFRGEEVIVVDGHINRPQADAGPDAGEPATPPPRVAYTAL